MSAADHPDPDWAATQLARVAEGDETAFAEFYHQFGGALFGLALQIMRNPKDAEDALQEGLTSIWRTAASFKPDRGNAFSWAAMIVRHKAIDRLRSRARIGRLEEAALRESTTVSSTDDRSAGAPLRSERSAQVREALQSIPEDQRQAVELAFFGGLTQEQIATRLAAPLGTVKARIRRGLLKLRDSLKEVA